MVSGGATSPVSGGLDYDPAVPAGNTPAPGEEGNLKWLVSVSGLYDLEAIRCSYLNETLGLDAASVARNSPSLLRPVPGVPFLAAVGGDEGEEFMRQNALVRAAWGDETPVDELVLPGGNHYHAVEALADPASPLCRAALRHLGVPA